MHFVTLWLLYAWLPLLKCQFVHIWCIYSILSVEVFAKAEVYIQMINQTNEIKNPYRNGHCETPGCKR